MAPGTRALRTRTQVLGSGLGQALITVGLVLLLFSAYQLWVTGLYTAREQSDLGSRLERSWALPEPAAGVAATAVPQRARSRDLPPLGSAFARIHAPRLGARWSWVVVEGVSPEDLKKGPGHYPGTALPGEVGNTVLSGHRTTYGAPFNDLPELQQGDAVVLETQHSWVTYRVTGRSIVPPSAVEVTLPVPREPGTEPSRGLLTLTTCHPEYSARERLVVHAEQDSVLTKAPGVRPVSLDERP